MPGELAAAIRRLASDSSARDAMGQAGRKLVESAYSWKMIVAQWILKMENLT